MKVFRKAELAKKLSSLKIEQQLAFAASCCERLMGVYNEFLREAEIQTNELERVLSLVWSFLIDGQSLDSVLENQKKKVYALIPDSDDYETDLTGHAQHACISVFYLLELIGDSSLSDKVDGIAAFVVDSVDWIIQDSFEAIRASEYTEEQIEMHPLMQKELNHQEADITLLINQENFAEAVSTIKNNAMNARHVLPVVSR